MKKFISILSIFSMLIFSSVTCCGFAQETEKKDNSKFAEVCACLAVAVITGATVLKSYVDYNNYFKDGYKDGEDSVSFKNKVWIPACNGLKTALNGTKYELGKAYDWVSSPEALNSTKSVIRETGDWAISAKDLVKNKCCEKLGWSCGNNSLTDEGDNSISSNITTSEENVASNSEVAKYVAGTAVLSPATFFSGRLSRRALNFCHLNILGTLSNLVATIGSIAIAVAGAGFATGTLQ